MLLVLQLLSSIINYIWVMLKLKNFVSLFHLSQEVKDRIIVVRCLYFELKANNIEVSFRRKYLKTIIELFYGYSYI